MLLIMSRWCACLHHSLRRSAYRAPNAAITLHYSRDCPPGQLGYNSGSDSVPHLEADEVVFPLMHPETRRALNAINQAFYATTAAEFDQTRGSAWAGWERLLPHLPARVPLRVLDVGCGNGRFGLFLRERLPTAIAYHGMDSSPALLERARAALTGQTDLTMTLEARDIVENPPDAGTCDLLGLFGVLHHIPGAAERQALVRLLAERVAPGGLLAFATWRFAENDRLRARIEPWPDELAGRVEAGDYLLDWRRGATALRYCHAVDDAEQDALVRASGLTEIERFRADGQDQRLNAYSLLRRPA